MAFAAIRTFNTVGAVAAFRAVRALFVGTTATATAAAAEASRSRDWLSRE